MKKLYVLYLLLSLIYLSEKSLLACETPSQIKAQTVHGSLFIVPNIPQKYIEHGLPFSILHLLRLALWEKIDEQGNKIGFDQNDLVVEVWATSQESNNWFSDQDHPIIKNTFPSYLPCKWLKGISEGETLTLYNAGEHITVELTCAQQRYKDYGSFDECLTKLLSLAQQYYESGEYKKYCDKLEKIPLHRK